MSRSRTHGLVDQALEKLNKIQNIGQDVKEHKDLDEVKTQLSTAKSYLNAIKHIGGLQTHDFSAELEATIAVLQDCENLFEKLPKSSLKSSQVSLEQLGCEKQLKPMQGPLDKALQQISVRVLETPVGLKGGHLVELSVLNETNAMVEPIFKKSLVLVDFLTKEGKIGGKNANETIALEPTKFEAFKLSASQQSASQQSTSQTTGSENVTAEYTRAIVQGNTAGDNMRTFFGNIGFEPGYTTAYTGTSKFVNNTMGNDAAVYAGDIGGQAAVEMMKNSSKK
ncbi:uncharacterized protein TrAtP1_009458 [Trichoderma atroviride]|uniref:uncharacterized protein n=1 Tax=Hypocrea atroviridis TaxID=63577 RepID=UPI00331B4FB6|nr:hypothetical protein TrAtP1_009458 [Trichoderma atroviride]